MNNEQILKMINKRIDDLAESYKVLNEHHHDLDNHFTEMRTEWDTTKGLVKFILGTSLTGLLLSLATVLKTFGVI